MRLEPADQYALWMLPGVHVDADVPEDEPVGDGVRATRRLTMNPDDHWIQWLGSIASNALQDDGIGLYVTGRAGDRDSPDAVRGRLSARARHLLQAFLLQGSGTFARGALLAGQYADGRMTIEAHEPIPPHLWTAGKLFVPTRAVLHRTVRLAAAVQEIFAVTAPNSPLLAWRRLRGAVLTVLEGNKMSNAEGERFHQFDRALDAVAKTGRRDRKTGFAQRMLTFASPHQLLLEMYDLRGQIEHFNSPLVMNGETLESLDPPTLEQRRERVNRMTRQADALVRTAVCRILENEALRMSFRTDQGIEAFWALPDEERQQVWGPPIDLATTT
jgi:hypothetical protein